MYAITYINMYLPILTHTCHSLIHVLLAYLLIHLYVYLFNLQIFQGAVREDWNNIQTLGYGSGKQQLLNQRVAEFSRNGNKFEGAVYEDRLLFNT